MKRIDINVDIGEGFEFDAELLLFATSANICCGAHAGSWEQTQETIGLALDNGVRIGMHPGYPDRTSMGRSTLPNVFEDEYLSSISRQVEQFFNFVPAAYLKPHGAFYNDSTRAEHPSFARLTSQALRFQLPIMGLPGSAHETAPCGFIREGFADRGYDANGGLTPRGTPGAVLSRPNDIARQAIALAKTVDSICIHGDTPGCVEIAELVKNALLEAGYEVGA